jgi:hypothetical protein
MNVKLNNRAQKALGRLNEPMKGRILRALVGLGNEPPEGDMMKLQGRGRLQGEGRRLPYFV